MNSGDTSDVPSVVPRWHLDATASEHAALVQSRLCRIVRLHAGGSPSDLKDWRFGMRTGSRTYFLKRISRRSEGAIEYRGPRLCKVADSARDYVGVLLCDGTTFEGFHTVNEPRALQCFRNGEEICRLVEQEEVVPPRRPGFINWVRRTFLTRREWLVIAGETVLGKIALQYPAGTARPILYWEMDGYALPIRTIRPRWIGSCVDTVIPQEGPTIEGQSLLSVYFIINIAFRIVFLHCDFGSG